MKTTEATVLEALESRYRIRHTVVWCNTAGEPADRWVLHHKGTPISSHESYSNAVGRIAELLQPF